MKGGCFGPQVLCLRFSEQINRAISSLVRWLQLFGARLRSSSPLAPPSSYRSTHFRPVFRLMPNSRHSSLIPKRLLLCRLTNRSCSSIGDTFFQGMRPV